MGFPGTPVLEHRLQFWVPNFQQRQQLHPGGDQGRRYSCHINENLYNHLLAEGVVCFRLILSCSAHTTLQRRGSYTHLRNNLGVQVTVQILRRAMGGCPLGVPDRLSLREPLRAGVPGFLIQPPGGAKEHQTRSPETSVGLHL